MHTIFPGRAIGAPHRIEYGTSANDSGVRVRSRTPNHPSPPEEKNAVSQSRNSEDRSRRLSLTNTPGFSLLGSPNRISFMRLRKCAVVDGPCATPGNLHAHSRSTSNHRKWSFVSSLRRTLSRILETVLLGT